MDNPETLATLGIQGTRQTQNYNTTQKTKKMRLCSRRYMTLSYMITHDLKKDIRLHLK